MSQRNTLTEADVCGIINRRVNSLGSQKALSEIVGISQAAISDQLNGKKPFSPSVLRAAGLRRVVTTHYEFLEDANV